MDLLIEPLFPGCPYSGFRPPTIQFCEENLCSYITQPANAISNIGYIFVFYYFFKLKNLSFFSIPGFISFLSFCIGMFSFFYHASFTFAMQFFDLGSMFLLGSFLFSVNLYRSGFYSFYWIYPYMFLLSAFSLFGLWSFKSYGILIFSVLILCTIITEYFSYRKNPKINYAYYKLSLAFFFLGLIIWSLDFFRVLCKPSNHFLQGHAVWHLLGAVSIYCLVRFFQENPTLDLGSD